MILSSHRKILIGFALVMVAAAALAGIALAWLYHIQIELGNADPAGIATRLTTLIRQGYWLILGVGAAGTLVSLGCIWWVWSTLGRVLRLVERSLSESSDRLFASSSELSTGSSQLAANANRAAMTIVDMGQTLQQLSAGAVGYTRSAAEAKRLADDARQATEAGSSDMRELGQAIEGIALGGREIARVIAVIDDIAFQTNLLALNAAVEAARAGAAGLGFGVVATEVQALARRCADAARETAERIEAGSEKTRLGQASAGQAAESLKRIAQCNSQLERLAAEVAAASERQANEVGGLRRACDDLRDLTQGNAQTAEETAHSTEALRGEVGSLRAAVVTLRNLVEGEAESHPTGEETRPAEIDWQIRPCPASKRAA